MYFTIILFHLSILSVISKNYLPKFEYVPPPLVFYSENYGDSSKNWSCKAWPSSSEITLYSTARMSTTNSNNPSQSQFLKSAPLHPLDSQYVEKGNLILRNIHQVRRLSKWDLHCLVKTSFGAVISRPFRVVEAKFGNFPSGTGIGDGEAQKVVKYFVHGNVAYIDCIPPESYPPAKIDFQVNGTNIQLSHRYRYIKRPNSRRVTLLIQAFDPRDQGFYRCVASNPITGELKTDPIVQQLKIKSPKSRIPVTIKMTISGTELKQHQTSPVSVELITVREGTNVTLFCVMEGAPPPSVKTFNSEKIDKYDQNRYISDKEFGYLTILKVTPTDEDLYTCSEGLVSNTAQLKVQKQLGISKVPEDIQINAFGSEARFSCQSSDPNITPQWYFNGKLRTQTSQSDRDSLLRIPNVRKEDLGVYQCVARSQDEWVTHVASLSLKNEPLVFQDDEKNNIIESRSRRSKKSVEKSSLKIRKGPLWLTSEELDPPSVQLIDDNLAVLLKWTQTINGGLVTHYRVQYLHRKVDSEHWLPISTLEKEITVDHFYLTTVHLNAQHVYMFRIVATLISSASRYSRWSREISFAHIHPVHPVIQQLIPLNFTHTRLYWLYSNSARFPVTQFEILYRETLQQGPKVFSFSPFIRVHIKNPNAKDAYLGPLKPGHRYQVVVYGINKGPPRRVTKFSPETNFDMPMPTTVFSMWGLKNNSESNTRLMFIILGSLAGLMLLVIMVLVLMCYCRERKSVVRLNRYKDPAKIINSDSSKAANSSFLLASINAATNNNNNQQKHVTVGSMERTSLLSSNTDQIYCQQKRQPPSGGSGHDMSEEASLHDAQAPNDICNSLNHHTMPQAGMSPQPPVVAYYKTTPGSASLPAGSLMRQNNSNQIHQLQYCQQQYVPQPQMYYTSNGYAYPHCGYIGGQMVPSMQMVDSNVIQSQGQQLKQEFSDMRSQDGGESVYSYFSQTSNAGAPRHETHRDHGTAEAGSQTINSNGTTGVSHRHHRRKRRKTNHSGMTMSEHSDNCSPPVVKMIPKMGYPGETHQMVAGREIMYDTPPGGRDPRIIVAPPGMVLVQPGMAHPDQSWTHLNNTLTRRGTPTLFVEPPRIRDYSEYGIPRNQMVPIQPQQLAHLSQQNLHLHNQSLSGYRDIQT